MAVKTVGGMVHGRRPLTFLLRCLVALALLAPVTLITSAPVTASNTIAPTTTCSNGVDNKGGLGLICQVTIVNTITANGGSARVTIRECHGASGAPTAACSTKVTVLTQPVTKVTQCNSSINGGGGTLRCSVNVTNNYVGIGSSSTAASVNQCVGSGELGIVKATIKCDPFPAHTTRAAITQCNGSANGGTLVGLICTATGTMSSSHGVTINQCNGSANGGGALVICSANIVNRVGTGSGGSGSTPPPTNMASVPTSSDNSIPVLIMLLVGLVCFGLAVTLVQRRTER